MTSQQEKKSDSTEPKRKDLTLIIGPNDEELTDDQLAELLKKRVQDILES